MTTWNTNTVVQQGKVLKQTIYQHDEGNIQMILIHVNISDILTLDI